jgi:hypothetical protein
VTPSAPPPVPRVELTLQLGDSTFDLRWRALVAGVVPAPRFGRESEVLATVRAAGQAGADLAVASLPPRLIGPAARAGGVPMAVKVSSLDEARVALGAGAALVLVPVDLAAAAAEAGWTAAMLVDDLGAIDRARSLAEDHPMPLAVDSSGLPPTEALAVESAAIPSGCRLVCTTDVRRTRRVVEAVAALLAARRHRCGPGARS